MDDTQGQTGPSTTDNATGPAKTSQGDDDVLSRLEQSLSESEEVEGAAGDGQAADDQSEDEEYEEIEEEGRRAKIPKWLKPHIEKGRDYTRKTTEVAEQRKAVEAREAEIKAESEFRRENFEKVADLRHLDRQLQALEKLTPEQWTQLEGADPQKAARLTREMTLLRNQRDRLAGELQQSAQQKALKAQQEKAKRIEDGLARIAKEIPNWSDELAGKLNDYGLENGYSLEELEDMAAHPSRVKNLHKAYLFDQLMARTRAKPKRQEAEPITPVQTISPRRTVSNVPTDRDEIGDWMRKRNAQLSRRKA